MYQLVPDAVVLDHGTVVYPTVFPDPLRSPSLLPDWGPISSPLTL